MDAFRITFKKEKRVKFYLNKQKQELPYKVGFQVIN